jgi:hypothetical protein
MEPKKRTESITKNQHEEDDDSVSWLNALPEGAFFVIAESLADGAWRCAWTFSCGKGYLQSRNGT